MRTLAIGDIHGCALHLDRLLAAVQPTAEDTLVFLGDYVDRGPDSRGAVERLIKLNEAFKCVFLRGNHELMMTRARTDKSERRMWMQVGGAQTLGSYGTTPGRSGTLEDVPEAHWRFLEKTCVDYFETDTHIFVHANLIADVPLNEQKEEALFWDFLDAPVAHMSGKTIVCGHSSQKSGQILNYGTAICIDTFAYGGGNLTCLNVMTGEYWQIDILGRVMEGRL
jgi:serine/threonine protein phosphatase 1